MNNDLKAALNLDIWGDDEPSNIFPTTIDSYEKRDCNDLFSDVLNHYEPTRKTDTVNLTQPNTQTTKTQPITTQPSKKKKKRMNKVKVSLKVERDDEWSDYI